MKNMLIFIGKNITNYPLNFSRFYFWTFLIIYKGKLEIFIDFKLILEKRFPLKIIDFSFSKKNER